MTYGNGDLPYLAEEVRKRKNERFCFAENPEYRKKYMTLDVEKKLHFMGILRSEKYQQMSVDERRLFEISELERLLK